jgi:hypothetical protein
MTNCGGTSLRRYFSEHPVRDEQPANESEGVLRLANEVPRATRVDRRCELAALADRFDRPTPSAR